ncbi:MAG: MFS transporter [Neisseria sp.]|uniref:MFS transporter n=1 Tax=Neisseria sp. TaxID=192066 RepID=UPI0026DC87AE|nr:MFS transporter [Neisseria sp.]MDO4641362.1 MFS transporter [Neisseria sp.]
MNMNKVWFYIALLSISIAGVCYMTPNEQSQQRLKEAVLRKKAAQQSKPKPNPTKPAATTTP